MLPDIEAASGVVSSRFLLYAAEPNPLSAVCLNQVGSFELRVRAICLREGSWASTEAESGTGVCGFSMLFSPARSERGRFLELSDPREVGRCCHDKVPDLKGTALLGDDLEVIAVFFGVWSIPFTPISRLLPRSSSTAVPAIESKVSLTS